MEAETPSCRSLSLPASGELVSGQGVAGQQTGRWQDLLGGRGGWCLSTSSLIPHLDLPPSLHKTPNGLYC